MTHTYNKTIIDYDSPHSLVNAKFGFQGCCFTILVTLACIGECRLFTVAYFFVRSFRYTASYGHGYLDFQMYRGGGRRLRLGLGLGLGLASGLGLGLGLGLAPPK